MIQLLLTTTTNALTTVANVDNHYNKTAVTDTVHRELTTSSFVGSTTRTNNANKVRQRRDEEEIPYNEMTDNDAYVQDILTNYPPSKGYINFSVLIKPAAQIVASDLFTPKANYMLQTVLNTTTKILCQKTQYLYVIQNQQLDACGRSSPSKFTTRLNAWNKELEINVQNVRRLLDQKSDEWSIGENLLLGEQTKKYIQWLQFSFRYEVLQVGKDIPSGVDDEEDYIQKLITTMIDYSIQTKEMTQLLRWWNAKVLMASPIGEEMEQFVPWTQVFGSWNVDSNSIKKIVPNSNETKAMMLNPLYQQLKPKPFHPLRIAGILLFIITVVLVASMIYLAKKQRLKREADEEEEQARLTSSKQKNTAAAAADLRTNEGLDHMLDRGKQESMKRLRARAAAAAGGSTSSPGRVANGETA